MLQGRNLNASALESICNGSAHNELHTFMSLMKDAMIVWLCKYQQIALHMSLEVKGVRFDVLKKSVEHSSFWMAQAVGETMKGF